MRTNSTAVVVGLVAALAGACSSGEPDLLTATAIPADPSATGLESPSATDDGSSPSPTPLLSLSPSPDGESESPSPSPSASRPPSDTDRARFISTYEPEGAVDVEHVAADLDGDGLQEVVVAYVRSAAQVAHLDVAAWDGNAYQVVFGGDGGPAARVDRLRVGDINADGRVELVTEQSGEGSTASLTVWAADSATSIVPLPAVGGCHDENNTYGVIGATIEDRDVDGSSEIYATCDGSPLPISAWTTDRYVWESGAYRHAPEALP